MSSGDEEVTKIKIRLTPEEIKELNANSQKEAQQQSQTSQPNNTFIPQHQTKVPQETIYRYAQQAALRTNLRMNKTRQDLSTAIKTLQKNRQSAQPYLSNSMHFQADNYPILMTDPHGKSLYNPNNSQSITQTSLDLFIKKNLNEEPNSYLSEVAGYNNFAIQNRRRRKHHFE